MALAGTLSSGQITNVPSGDTAGGVSQLIYHVMVSTYGTFTAGTWAFAHNLPYTPTWCVVTPRLASGTAPAATNALVGWCPAETTSTVLALALLTGTSMQYDVIYG